MGIEPKGWVFNEHGFSEFPNHYEYVEKWKEICKERIRICKLKELRLKQFEESIDDENMFRFELKRRQTRYKQINYAKSSYAVYVKIGTYTCDLK